MEFEVPLFVLAHGGGVADRLGQRLEEAVEIGGGGGIPIGDGPLAGEEFKGEADFEGLDQIFFRDRGDVGAGAGVYLDEALDGELLEGVADGGEADVELRGEFVGKEALAGEEVAGEDGVAEGVVYFVGSALLAQGCQGHMDRVSEI